LGSLDNLDLLVVQAVKLVHQLVDLPVSGVDLALEVFLYG
jgi:hypothetical protein